jgi:hypothetical protein
LTVIILVTSVDCIFAGVRERTGGNNGTQKKGWYEGISQFHFLTSFLTGGFAIPVPLPVLFASNED